MCFSDVVLRSRAVSMGDDVLLQCELSSNLAMPHWTLDGSDLQGYGLSSGFRTGTDGLLIIEAQQEQSGLYTCYTVENNIMVAVVSYNITIYLSLLPAPPVETNKNNLSPSVNLPTPTVHPYSERPLPPAPAPLLPHSDLLSPRNMEVMYLSLITILGSLCVVLTVVLVYVGFCLQVGHRGKYSLRAAAAAYPNNKRNQKQQKHSLMELKTISSNCNGNGVCNGTSKQHNNSIQEGGFLQIVPGEGHPSPNEEPPPPAPPLPPTPQLPSPDCDFPSGLSSTLPSVLRRMNGNSYVLLQQSDSETTSPQCYSFAEELNKILEKRKHTQLLPRPDESSV